MKLMMFNYADKLLFTLVDKLVGGFFAVTAAVFNRKGHFTAAVI